MRGAEGLELCIVSDFCSRVQPCGHRKVRVRVPWGPALQSPLGREQGRYAYRVLETCISAGHTQGRRILGRRCAQSTLQESVRNFVSTSASSRGDSLAARAGWSTASRLPKRERTPDFVKVALRKVQSKSPSIDVTVCQSRHSKLTARA